MTRNILSVCVYRARADLATPERTQVATHVLQRHLS